MEYFNIFYLNLFLFKINNIFFIYNKLIIFILYQIINLLLNIDYLVFYFYLKYRTFSIYKIF